MIEQPTAPPVGTGYLLPAPPPGWAQTMASALTYLAGLVGNAEVPIPTDTGYAVENYRITEIRGAEYAPGECGGVVARVQVARGYTRRVEICTVSLERCPPLDVHELVWDEDLDITLRDPAPLLALLRHSRALADSMAWRAQAGMGYGFVGCCTDGWTPRPTHMPG